ncbi:MAG: glyoxalase [Variovorax sp.]|nr:glyoxalase [Variovorax sp.]
MRNAAPAPASPAAPEDLGTRHRFHGVQPVLPVADVTRAARYFCGVLGFELDFIAGEPPSYARVKKGGGRDQDGWGDPVYLRLWQCRAHDTRPWRGEIVIHVGHDIDGLHAAYLKRGVTVLEPPTSQPWGLREFAIREPDGHVLRFCGYL